MNEFYSTWQMRGGNLMIWLAVGYGKGTSLVFLTGRQKYTHYIQVLNSKFLPYSSELGEEERMFQQDETRIHTAIWVKNWFAANNVRILPWTAKVPDLNIVENIRAKHVGRLYAGCKQFESLTELWITHGINFAKEKSNLCMIHYQIEYLKS